MRALVVQWNRLANNSAWRNPSFEPNFLIPAFKHLGDTKVKILVVFDENAVSEDDKLVGLIPFRKKRIFHLPISTLEVWKHEQCFDSTPLLRTEHKNEVWKVCCDFLRNEGVGLLSLDTVSAESDFNEVIEDGLSESHYGVFQKKLFERAAFRPLNSSEEYSKEFISKNARKGFRRQNRRLSELGDVTFERSTSGSDFDWLADEFLSLEASGWKGNDRTALACNVCTSNFYRELVRESANAGKARFLTLRLNGNPIAMLSDIQSGQTVYSYKTAFNEEFADYSPGIQVEFKNIDFLHADGIQLADSCTSSDNSAINRIWGQSLKFQDLVIALKPGIPRFVTSVLPTFQSIVRHIKRKK